jgi:hypothetical protein
MRVRRATSGRPGSSPAAPKAFFGGRPGSSPAAPKAFDLARRSLDDRSGVGTAATVRDEPRRAGFGALVGALGLGLASGCGSTVSLDQHPAQASDSSSTAAASTDAHASAAVDTGTADTSAPPPDVPATDVPPLPPELCPAECTVELPLVWTWESEPLPSRDEPPGGGTQITGRHVASMVRAFDGSFVVAENRGTEPWLTRVDRDGALMWSRYFDLACDCALVELALTPLGDIMVLGEGVFNGALTYLSVFQAELGPNDVYPYWLALEAVWGSEDRPARVGSIMPIGNESAAVLVAESGLEGEALEKDWFEIFYFVSGVQEGAWLLDTQLATTPPRRPRGVALSRGELAATIPGGLGLGDYVAWMPPFSSSVSAIELSPGPIDAIVAGPDAGVVVAGIERPVDAPALLRVAGLPHAEPPAWSHDVEVPADAIGLPALAMDGGGSAYVALRIVDASSREPAVWLSRLHPDGTLAWSITVPLPASESPVPVALTLADDGGDLVLAAIVDERLHLERREQGCRCD